MLSKCCGHEENPGPGCSKQPAPFAATGAQAVQHPLALASWGQPLSDCTIFFAAHPGDEARGPSASCRGSRPGLGVPRSGSPHCGEWGEGWGVGSLGTSAYPPYLLLEPRRLPGLSGSADAREEREPSLRPRGSRNRIAQVWAP